MDRIGQAEYIERLKDLLNLHHWNITLFLKWEGMSDEWGTVEYDQCERRAVIRIRSDCPDEQRYAVIAHEMVHILMTDLEFIACNGRSTDIMDLFNRELERVVDVIAQSLVVPVDIIAEG